jgi:branched-chain amino acid transport system ATP-binding protein
MLQLHGLNVAIQASHILRDVTLEVGAHELICLVGRNGAGKTTTLRTIMGYLRPESGTVTFQGQSLAGQPTHAIARLGIGFSPEESAIFGDLTVAENIEMATWTRPSGRPAAERVALAYEVFPRLKGLGARGGTQLSGGERKMLSIARALALDPELLLLDEPFEGLSPAIIPSISESIAAIAHRGHGILLAESNIHHVPEYTTRLYVIERGEIIFAGSPEDARRDGAVLRIIGGAPDPRPGRETRRETATRLGWTVNDDEGTVQR